MLRGEIRGGTRRLS